MALTTSLEHYYVHSLSTKNCKALHGVVTHEIANLVQHDLIPATPPLQMMIINGKRIGLIIYEYLGSMSRRKGANPSFEDIKNCDVVDIDVLDIDVLIVAGRYDGSEMLLLGCIMKGFNPFRSYGGNLYKQFIRALPRGGREVRRTGGSS